MSASKSTAHSFGHRIRRFAYIEESDRHWRVRAGQVVLAESQAVLLAFETGEGAQPYFPATDVNMKVLRPLGGCKIEPGVQLFCLRGDKTLEPVARGFSEKDADEELAGYLSFFGEQVVFRSRVPEC